MLANAAGVLFFFRSARDWSLLEFIIFAALMFAAIEALNWGVFWMFENHIRPRVPAGGQALWKRGWKDYAFIAFNKAATVGFSYHLAHYCYYSASMPRLASELTVLNTLIAFPLLYVVYDLPYSMFHRALHINALYALIHKHHHREAAPVHGHDDAVNTHPFEFVVGEYLHLLAVHLVALSVGCHMATAVAFISLGGIMASLSHTRFDIDVRLGPVTLFCVKDHDTHHKMLKGNYGQYTQVWDQLFKTFYEWVPVKIAPGQPTADGGGPYRLPVYPTKALNPALAAKASCALGNTNDTDSAAGGISPAALAALRDAPASCAVFPAHTPLGLRLVAALHARGAAHVTALVPSPAAAEAVAEAARAGALPRAAATATATAVVDPAAAADASGPAFDALKAALVRNGVTAVFFLAQQQQYSYYNLGIVDAADAATAAAEAEAEAAEEQEHDACYTSPVDAGDGDARAYADAAAQRVLRSPVLTPPHLRSHGSRAAATVRAAEGLLAAAAASAADAAAATGSANADASAAPLIAFVALTDPFAAAHCEGSFLAPDVSAATETAAALLHHASAGRGPSVGEAAGAQLMAEVRVLSENLKPAAKSALTAAVVAAPNVYGAGPADKALARRLLGAARAMGGHIMSSGANVQSVTHADNAVHALILAAARAAKHGKAPVLANSNNSGNSTDAKTVKTSKKSTATAAAVIPSPLEAANNADGTDNAAFDDESFVDTLLALRDSAAYTVVSDAAAQYPWDLAERLRGALALPSLWDGYHVYNHLLLPLAYAGHAVRAVTGRARAPWPLHLSAGEVEDGTRTLTFDVDKAVEVLGYRPVAGKGVDDLVADAKAAGRAALRA